MLIAHITDTHILEPKRSPFRNFKLNGVGLFRPLDWQYRSNKLIESLKEASKADLIAITGDLTEDGHPDQFAELARCLQVSKVTPDKVLLVPGNHDYYWSADAWDEAFLTGPLSTFYRRMGFRKYSEDLTIVLVNTGIYQNFIFSKAAPMAQCLPSDFSEVTHKDVLMLMHHPPVPSWASTVDGFSKDDLLYIKSKVETLKGKNLAVLAGHVHKNSTHKIFEKIPMVVKTSQALVERDGRVRFFTFDRGGLRDQSST